MNDRRNPFRDCVFIVIVVAVLCALIIPPWRHRQALGMAVACKSNLKNIGTALEMYSTDATGRFPEPLAYLTPNYLKAMPTCPAAGYDTYSPHFESIS